MPISKLNTVSNEDIYAVISRNELLEILPELSTKDLVLISISEPSENGCRDEALTDEDVNGFKDSIRVKFWDIEEDIGRYKVIPDEVAKQLQEFILKNKDSKFLVHCKAGQSRSAGVAKAVECIKHFGIGEEAKYLYKTGFSSVVDSNRRYSPNLVVFDKIMGADRTING